MPDINQNPLSLFGGVAEAVDDTCPRCECELIFSEVKEEIDLGQGDCVAVRIPIQMCKACDFRVSTPEAEHIRDAAVRLHKRLLTPDQIKAIREGLGFSRREFYEAYGIPIASMERWENGRIVQNKSNDTLLRLLQNKGIASAVDRRRLNFGCEWQQRDVLPFKALKQSEVAIETVRQRASQFQLRRM